MYGIDLDSDLFFEHASLREFLPNERHIERICESDVLLMVLSGVLRFNEDGVDYEIMPGEYYIQHFRGFQYGNRVSDSPKYLYIHFRGQWRDSRSCLPKRGTFVVDEIIEDISRIHDLSYGDGNKTEILAKFYGILTFLMNGGNHTESQAEKILRLLTCDLKDPPSLDELAELCHFSKNHIINIVKNEFGMTPYEYLKRERLRNAVRLIVSTSVSLDYIAEQSGFGDYTVFFRAFKSVYGISPSEWREKYRK